MAMRRFNIWLAQIRANFLLLPVLLVSLGASLAFKEGRFDWILFYLTLTGVVLAHISVNLFNEYSDYRTGIDSNTNRTPFSGGSGMLQEGLTDPQTVRFLAWLTLLIALAIGLYLALRTGFSLIIIIALGAFATVFYTDYLSKWILGELFAGLCLGTLVVIGSYLVQSGKITVPSLVISIPPGILTGLLLLLNEFPDAEADKKGGRKHLVIKYGKRKSLVIYGAFLCLSYAIIVAFAIAGTIPKTTLIACSTVPLACAALYGGWQHVTRGIDIIGALRWNILLVLGTDFLLILGILTS